MAQTEQETGPSAEQYYVATQLLTVNVSGYCTDLILLVGNLVVSAVGGAFFLLILQIILAKLRLTGSEYIWT